MLGVHYRIYLTKYSVTCILDMSETKSKSRGQRVIMYNDLQLKRNRPLDKIN